MLDMTDDVIGSAVARKEPLPPEAEVVAGAGR